MILESPTIRVSRDATMWIFPPTVATVNCWVRDVFSVGFLCERARVEDVSSTDIDLFGSPQNIDDGNCFEVF